MGQRRQALEQLLFRAAHPIVTHLAPYPVEQRAALLPSVVRIMLAAFLEEVASAAGPGRGAKGK